MTRTTTGHTSAGGRRWRRLSPWFRLSAYLLSVALLSALWLGGRVHAELAEKALLIGRELETANRLHEGTTQLVLNGQALSLNSSTVPLSVHEVIERFAQQCSRATGQIGPELLAWQARGARLSEPLRPERFGIMRSEPSANEGSAACFSRPSNGGLNDLFRDLGRALDSGDLSAVGQLRYVFARRSKSGAGAHVISVWSRGALKLPAMFPETGDVPGSDLLPGVKPPGAQRILSVVGESTSMGASVYRSASPPALIFASYDQQLSALGYRPQAAVALAEELPTPLRVYQKPGAPSLLVMVHEQRAERLVSAFGLGTLDYARVTLEE